MFTGIIEAMGTVSEAKDFSDYLHLTINIDFDETPKLGDSIAINGACMTISSIYDKNSFGFDVSIESKNKTNLNKLKIGDAVNIERSLKVGARIDGHFVSGHVDAVGEVSQIKISGKDRLFYFSFPTELKSQIVSKGSIAVNGISLTVIEPKNNEFHVTIVPHTWEHTVLKHLEVGSKVNLETDLLAKYIQNFAVNNKDKVITKEFLINAGF
jgi:riboflavin synthase